MSHYSLGMALQVVILGGIVWLARWLPRIRNLESRIHNVAASIADMTQDSTAASTSPVAQMSGDLISMRSQLSVLQYQVDAIIAATGITMPLRAGAQEAK